MRDIWLIIRKEWIGFAKSDRGIFFVYGILVLAWSFLLSTNITMLLTGAEYLWLVFFSVIVSGNFSNTTFVAERMNGSLEILLTSGVTRNAILSGKIAFVIIMSTVLGLVCYVLALALYVVQGESLHLIYSITPIGKEIILYITACFMNAACGAWLSVRINNPRLLHFINLFVLGIIVILHAVLSAVFTFTLWSLIIALVVCGVLFYVFAIRDFKSERVIQPVVY